jgi:MFS family permease
MWAPIWVVYLRAGGLSYGQIMTLDAIWWIGIVAGELPTGFVGDRIGWRNSLVVGHALTIAGVLTMGLTTAFLPLAGIYLLWALGATLKSGSADAWLYEILDRRLDSDQFTRVKGRGRALQLSASGAGAVVGGAIAAYGLSYPFFATAAVRALGLVALLALPTIAVDPNDRLTVGEMRSVLGQLTAPSLRWIVAGAALTLGLLGAMSRLTQPISLRWLAVPHLGVLYAGFTGVAALASARADWIRANVGLRGWLAVGVAGMATLSIASLAVPLVAMPALFALRGVRGALDPLLKQHVNDHIETTGRATTLSGVSMAVSAAGAPLAVGLGQVTDLVGPFDALAVAGGGFALLLGGIVVGRSSGFGSAAPSPESVEAD